MEMPGSFRHGVKAASSTMTSIPGLAIADHVQPSAERLGPFTEGVELCFDAAGDVQAYCQASNGGVRVDVSGIATFVLKAEAGDVLAIPHRSILPGLVEDTYHHCVLPLILSASGTSVLHASAVIAQKGVVVFCAESGTGKSTIAVGLSRRGHTLWADDAVAIDTAHSTPLAIPLPFNVRLRPDSMRLFGDGAAFEASLHPGEFDPMPLALLCLLRRDNAATPVAVERLKAASACHGALAHSYCFSARDPLLKRRTVESCLSLAARVPAYEIRFRPGLDHLTTILDALEELVAR